MTPTDPIDRILHGVPIPADGLVLRAALQEPTTLLSASARTKLVRWTDGSAGEPECGSTDEDGHWAVVRRLSPRYWVAAHVNLNWGDEEYVLFSSAEDARTHYEQVVRGQQDATGGKAWRTCDVPGVLAGKELLLAERVGYSYEEAARQYTEDRDAAVAAWALLDALTRQPC